MIDRQDSMLCHQGLFLHSCEREYPSESVRSYLRHLLKMG